MKKSYWIILFIWAALFGTAVYVSAQDRYLKESDIENAHIKKGLVLYDTLQKGQGGAFRFILTDFGTVDTTKQIIIKYEAFQIGQQVDTIDCAPAFITYSTDWLRKGEPPLRTGWHEGTISYSSVGSASYTFTGTKLEIFGERGLSNGAATITVGNVTQTVSFKGTQLLPFKAFSITVPRGTYTVTIKPIGDGNVLLDYLVVYK